MEQTTRKQKASDAIIIASIALQNYCTWNDKQLATKLL